MMNAIPKVIFRKLRLTTKLYLTILPMIFLAIGISAYLNNLYQEREMLSQAQQSAQTYADLIRESLVNMMITREQVDDAYLAQLNKIPDIHNLHIQFSTDNLHLREMYQSEDRLARLQRREQVSAPMTRDDQAVFETGEPQWRRNDQMFNAIIPFKAVSKCQQCHDVPVGHVLGAAHMNISIDRISASIRNNWIRSFWVFLGFTSAAIAFSIVLYRIFVAKRMNALVQATKVIGSGNLEGSIGGISSTDELGELASAFDAMRVQLKKSQEKLIHSERLSTIGQMASSIIHDFRNPMTTINLAVSSLQQGKGITPEKTENWYRLIRDAIQRMVIMAQELLDFSRGDSRLEKQELSLDEFIKLLVQSVTMNLEQAKVKLEVQENYKGTALIDADRLHRALVNIITNAQDAMPQGGTLSVTTGKEDSFLYFTISDTGVGIPPEIKNQIFDAFVTAGKKKGTGLGLAITKRIIDQHGGTIEVESEQGKGTKFRVKIPME